MNKFASIKVQSNNGIVYNAILTSEQMAQIGISMGWIKPVGEYGTKLASSIDKSGRKVFVKVASGTRKFKMNLSKWLDLSMANGWIMEDMNKVAGFWSAVGDLAGSAVNAVGNTWQGAKNLANKAVSGVKQIGSNVAQAVGNAAQTAGRFVTDAAGRVYNAAGQAVNATVNAAGQVVDATGRVIGQAAQYAGQLANEATQAYNARRKAGDTNFMQAGGQLVSSSPVGMAARGLAQGAKAVGNTAVQAGKDVAQGYQQARARNAAPAPKTASSKTKNTIQTIIDDYYNYNSKNK